MPRAVSLRVAVVNTPESGIPDEEAAALTSAVATQVERDFNPAWHLQSTVRFIPSEHKIPVGCAWIKLCGSADGEGYLGYHDETPEGLPIGYVFMEEDRKYDADPGITLSHEVLEMILDPRISDAVYHWTGARGEFHAKEACDAVEADDLGYAITLAGGRRVRVSDFVLPDYFDDSAADRPGARYSFMGNLSGPFSLATGGYQSVYVEGKWTQRTKGRSLAALQRRKGPGSRMAARAERGAA